ncbi:MAG: ATP-dependent zinc protease [Gammaproteobacteria bacterium]|nr:ATP-dependent zinc protease [Gammaproteobacteria bacterium]
MLVFGWREWIKLPELALENIKAKVDTGARTSCLHAFSVRPYVERGRQRVEFQIHPRQRNRSYVRTCHADVIDQRVVTDSGGHKEQRWVIETMLEIGPHQWPIEITLSPRDDMMFRMLIGRTALKHRAVVDSSRSYLIGKKVKKKAKVKI